MNFLIGELLPLFAGSSIRIGCRAADRCRFKNCRLISIPINIEYDITQTDLSVNKLISTKHTGNLCDLPICCTRSVDKATGKVTVCHFGSFLAHIPITAESGSQCKQTSNFSLPASRPQLKQSLLLKCVLRRKFFETFLVL